MFVLALLLGIISGTYSSIFNASPLLVVWHDWEDRKRLARRGSPKPRRPRDAPGADRCPHSRTTTTAPAAEPSPARRQVPGERRVASSDVMTDARHRWVFPDPMRLDPVLREAARAHGLGTFAATVLARRGVGDPAPLAAFLARPVAGLNDPRLLPDADRLLARIAAARECGERVMVFGDFDADGLTGLAQPRARAPAPGHRRPAVRAVPARGGPWPLARGGRRPPRTGASALIITVDTGSTSVAEVAAAHARDIDVLITDHHHVPEVLPRRVALVNPHRADAHYPDRRPVGQRRRVHASPGCCSGSSARRGGRAGARRPRDDRDRLDVSPSWARTARSRGSGWSGCGRRRGRGSRRCSRAPAHARRADLETVGFVLAPRLNAAGRVGEAMDAARLLLAETPEQAAELAATLEAANTPGATSCGGDRRGAGRVRHPGPGQAPGQQALFDGPSVAAPGIARRRPDAPAMLLHGPWPVGIVGLVAGRLADETGRPTIVGAELGDVIRASCRWDGRVHLAETLTACARPVRPVRRPCAAAGFELPADRWDAFTERFLAAAAANAPVDARPPLPVDLALPAAYVDYSLYRDLARLAPCGTGNPEPLVAVLGLTVQRVATRERGTHAARPAPGTRRHRRDRVRPAGPRGERCRKGIGWTSSRGSRAGCSEEWRRCSWRSATCRRRARIRARRRSWSRGSQGCDGRSAPARPRRERRGRVTARPQPAQRRRPARARGGPGLPGGVPLAAVLSIVGLFVIGIVTYAVGSGDIPFTGAGPNAPGATDDPTVQRTPTPPGVVEVPTAPPVAEVSRSPGPSCTSRTATSGSRPTGRRSS